MTQIELAKKLKITGSSLNEILMGKRGITKKRAFEFESICKSLGYNFTAQDWMFEPRKIRTHLFNLRGLQK